MNNKIKDSFIWLFPLIGIVLLVLVMLKRAPETFDDDNIYYSNVEDVDETLLAYREIDGIGVKMDKLYALALDAENKIYITGDNQLLILKPDGAELAMIKLSTPGKCLNIAANGDIFIGFRKHIEVYDSTGKEKSNWKQINDNSVITSLTLCGEYLFVADAGTRNIWKFDLNGKLSGKIGVENKENGIPKFIVPSPYFDIVAAGNTIWIVNPGRHKLENFTVDGTLRGMWGKYSPDMEGFCGCCNPTHIAILKDGSFVTSEKGYPRVKIYDIKGTFTGIVAAGRQFSEGTKVLDLAVDSEDRILVLDPKMKKIRFFVKK